MNINKLKLKGSSKFLLLGAVVTALIAGCSSGGGGGGTTAPVTVPPVTVTPPATGTLAGTAATGAPIEGKVVAVDKNGLVFTGTANATGAYTINVASGTAPFILTITGISGGKMTTLSSVATAAGQTVNITPLTDLIVSSAAGQPGGASLNSLCTPDSAGAVSSACTTALTNATTGTKLADAVTAVKNMVAALNTANVDPLNGPFTADGTGMDGLLDQILMTPANAQGDMATVTLIAVPTASLGTVTMPATAGDAPTVGAGNATAGDVTTATTAQTALGEIRACFASLSALYPANMTTPPSSGQVSPFFDSTFSFNANTDATAIATFLSTAPGQYTGTNTGFAVPGLKFEVPGFTKFDFSKETGNGSTYPKATGAFATTSAWVNVVIGGAGDGEIFHWKMTKGAAYTGCPSGWKVVGNDHFYLHMMARIGKGNFGTEVYNRFLALHVPTTASDAGNIAAIVVRNPALSVYSGNPSLPVGAATPIGLIAAPAVTPPAVRKNTMGINDTSGYYFAGAEAIQSCQDLALVTTGTMPTTATPCYDETQLAPGAIFKYQVYLTTNTTISSIATGGGVADYSFPFMIKAVPLARSFVIANQADLFAQYVSVTPADRAALNTAVSGLTTGALMDGVITFTYTNSSVYGTQTNHCGIGVSDSTNTQIINAEMNAAGTATQQTSCTFYEAGLNYGTMAKPSASFGGVVGYVNIGNTVLGNQAVSSKSYQ